MLKVSSTPFVLIVLLVFAAQHALALGAASAQMAYAQTHTYDDFTLVCTGNTMKWVSLSKSAQMGKMVFADPTDTKALPDIVDCTNKVQSDIGGDALFSTSSSLVRFMPLPRAILPGYQSPYSAFVFLAHLVRGPPSNL